MSFRRNGNGNGFNLGIDSSFDSEINRDVGPFGSSLGDYSSSDNKEKLTTHAKEYIGYKDQEEKLYGTNGNGSPSNGKRTSSDSNGLRMTHTSDTYDKDDRIFGASHLNWLLPRKNYGDKPVRGFEAETMSRNDDKAERAYWGRFFIETTDATQHTACASVKCGRNASGDILGGGLCEECSSRGLLRF